MLKVSSNNITFNESETIKSLTLENLHPQNIIFKIKVNSVGYLSIQPNKGFIRANSSVPFIIKSINKQLFQVKVLFTYGFIQNKNYQFNKQWQLIKQNSKFQHSIIIVKRLQPYKSNQRITIIQEKSPEKEQQITNYQQRSKRYSTFKQKRLSSPLSPLRLLKRQNQPQSPYRLSKRQNQQQSPRRLSRKQSLSLRKNKQQKNMNQKEKRKNDKNYEEYSKEIFLQQQREDQLPFYSAQQMQQLIQELHNEEKMLENQKIKNIKLHQQLSISQAKLKEITEDKMYIETHKSIGIVCEDYHTTFTHLVILGLACFVFGFFLGKIQAQIV